MSADLLAAGQRLALELECLLMDTRDTAVVSKWWDSAHEALAQWQTIASTPPDDTLVYITWWDSASDWPWFHIREVRGEWLLLQGADYPDGSATHNGDTFLVHKSEIRRMSMPSGREW